MENIKIEIQKTQDIDPKTKEFLIAVKHCAMYLGTEALARGCFNVYHLCTMLEKITEEEQTYIPYQSNAS